MRLTADELVQLRVFAQTGDLFTSSRALVLRLLAEHADLAARTTWRTIGSAPKGGTDVLLAWRGDSAAITGWWCTGTLCWRFRRNDRVNPEPDLWMPLPPAPGKEPPP